MCYRNGLGLLFLVLTGTLSCYPQSRVTGIWEGSGALAQTDSPERIAKADFQMVLSNDTGSTVTGSVLIKFKNTNSFGQPTLPIKSGVFTDGRLFITAESASSAYGANEFRFDGILKGNSIKGTASFSFPSVFSTITLSGEVAVSKGGGRTQATTPPPTAPQPEQPTNMQSDSPVTAAAADCSGQPDAHHIAEQVRSEIASYEKTGGFRSPLDDQRFLESIVKESAHSCVPPWLLFAQARFETTFGDPINATTRDGVTFIDGSTGNAHNLFNIRPGANWQGKVLDTGGGGKFRVYNNYDECVRDYLSLLVRVYKGKTLAQIINEYFPASENGSARVQGYIGSVVQFAATLGFTVDGGTIPIP
jgi:flagellum-specific peptidoglycan hydrolase FlgJ